MHSKQVWCAALLSAAFAWAGTMPATAQLFGIFQGATQEPAATQPEAAPGKPLALKKYTKRRSRGSRHKRSHHIAKSTADKSATDKSATDTSAGKRQVNDDDAAEATTAASADARQTTADNTEAKAGTAAGTADATPPAAVAASAPAWSAIPSSVANARAELEGGTADRKAAFVPTPVATPAPIDPATPPRQHNADTAAAARAAQATPQTTAQAAATPVAGAGPALASADTAEPIRLMSAVAQSEEATSSNDTTWSRTSLIGKIFVAFGGLLMLASAARLYIG